MVSIKGVWNWHHQFDNHFSKDLLHDVLYFQPVKFSNDLDKYLQRQCVFNVAQNQMSITPFFKVVLQTLITVELEKVLEMVNNNL